MDVADPATLEALAKAVYDANGRVDILHNNAGIGHADNIESDRHKNHAQQTNEKTTAASAYQES